MLNVHLFQTVSPFDPHWDQTSSEIRDWNLKCVFLGAKNSSLFFKHLYKFYFHAILTFTNKNVSSANLNPCSQVLMFPLET